MSIIYLIYKKKDPMDTKNYSEIAVFTKCYWILSISLPNILKKYTNGIIRNIIYIYIYQREIIWSKSTKIYKFTVRYVMKTFYEFEKEIYTCFVDFMWWYYKR